MVATALRNAAGGDTNRIKDATRQMQQHAAAWQDRMRSTTFNARPASVTELARSWSAPTTFRCRPTAVTASCAA